MFNPLHLLNTLDFSNDKYELSICRFKKIRMDFIYTRPMTPLNIIGGNDESNAPVPDAAFNSNTVNSLRRKNNVIASFSKEGKQSRTELAKYSASVVIQALYRGWAIRNKYFAIKYGIDFSAQSSTFSNMKLSIDKLPPTGDLELQNNLLHKFKKYNEIYERTYFERCEYPYFAATFIQSFWRMKYASKAWARYRQLSKSDKNCPIGRFLKNIMARAGGNYTETKQTFANKCYQIQREIELEKLIKSKNQKISIAGTRYSSANSKTNQIIDTSNSSEIARLKGDYSSDIQNNRQIKGRSRKPDDFVEESSATIIQRNWKSYNYKRIFKFYKNIINLRNGENPRELLRFINPKESQLIDTAAAMHLKFRLGGYSFPPTIYYKIFVNTGLIDLNSFSPRDYTKEAKKITPNNLFNNFNPFPNTHHDGWYSRIENNPWRPISDKIWDTINDSDYNPYISSTKTVKFHHSALCRHQDILEKRKQKKREWFKKMYQKGDALDVETPKNGLDNDHDLDDDELVEWTQNLDFEFYCESWTRLATSGLSQDPKMDGIRFNIGDINNQLQEVEPVPVEYISRPTSGRSERSLRELFIQH